MMNDVKGLRKFTRGITKDYKKEASVGNIEDKPPVKVTYDDINEDKDNIMKEILDNNEKKLNQEKQKAKITVKRRKSKKVAFSKKITIMFIIWCLLLQIFALYAILKLSNTRSLEYITLLSFGECMAVFLTYMKRSERENIIKMKKGFISDYDYVDVIEKTPKEENKYKDFFSTTGGIDSFVGNTVITSPIVKSKKNKSLENSYSDIDFEEDMKISSGWADNVIDENIDYGMDDERDDISKGV